MFTDLTGTRRLKVGLHTHTTLSDGRKTPAEAAAIYRAQGYDAVALTDHWVYGPARTVDGLTILSGCEYNVGGGDARDAVYHIVGVGMTRDPGLTTALRDDKSLTSAEKARRIIAAIREADGLAVLAHPAWSLNSPARCLALGDFDATEIYNAVSECGMSDRPYSGQVIDMLATEHGFSKPLLATDDAHYYAGDACRGMVMAEADYAEANGLVAALRDGRFYATQGPELHVSRAADGTVRVICSPVSKIVFLSNNVWTAGRVVRGDGLTEAAYSPVANECFLRVEATDAVGNVAYSNIMRL